MEKYEIHSLFEGDYDDCDKRVYQLATIGDDGSVRTPLLEFGKKRSNREAANKLFDVIKHIENIGIATAIKKRTVKRLSGNTCEITIASATIRAYCYNDSGHEMLVIVGIEGETHKGGSAHSSRFIKKYESKVAIVEQLLSVKEGYHD